MEVRTRTEPGGESVLSLSGRLTMVAGNALQTALDAASAGGARLVVVDLHDVEFMDSSGLGALVGGLRSMRAVGGDLRIARPGAQVRTVLELTTMDRVLRPHETVEDALGAS